MDSREPPQASPPSRIDSPKKRGRPRKYSPILAPTPLSSDAPADLSPTSDEPPAKKSRGRPAGSGKTFFFSLGVGGTYLTPHVILVNTGEDIAAKITSFCEEGPRQFCILSAHGEVSSATLRPSTSDVIVYCEGRFQIISLSGSFNPSEEGGCGTGGMSMRVALGGTDGKMLGGSVSGKLVAASKTQVILSSFIVEEKKKSSPKEKSGPSPAASNSSDEKDDSSSGFGSDS